MTNFTPSFVPHEWVDAFYSSPEWFLYRLTVAGRDQAGEGRIFELDGTAVEINFSKSVPVRCEVWLRTSETPQEVALVEPVDLMNRDDVFPWTLAEAAHLAWGLLQGGVPGVPAARLQWITQFEEG